MGEEIISSPEPKNTALNPPKEESSYQGQPSFGHAIELISSLIALSYSVKVFAVKWQLIREKLEELFSHLTTIENFDSSEIPASDTSLFSTIQAITATLKDCDDLARRCVELSYSGKLLMQSDLDIVSARLNSHSKNLSEIYTRDLLSHSYAIVLSRPGLGASKDDMEIYVNDLFSRLKIGSADMKKQALISLNEVIREDDKYVRIVVQVDSFINLLVNLLDLQENGIQEEAIKAVTLIAGSENYRGIMIAAGIIAPLIRVLECGSELGKEFAARCLQKLTENSDNAWSISAHGGVTALLKICTRGDYGGELVGLACGVLKNLIGVEEIKRFIVEEGAISSFIKLARSKEAAAQICSIDFLRTMASGNEAVRHIIVREGGVRALVRVLDPKSLFPSKARATSLKAIMSLHFPSVNSLTLLMNYGFLDHMLYFLRYGEVSVQELALKASFWLCGTSEEAKKIMGDVGFMAELVKFLDSNSFEVREMAAETLYSMILVPRNRKKFVQNDKNVGLVLQMLDKDEANSGNKKHLLSLLMSLTSCNSARKRIVHSGYLKKIEMLADSENSDAKKIVKKLSSNRLRSIFSGILHLST